MSSKKHAVDAGILSREAIVTTRRPFLALLARQPVIAHRTRLRWLCSVSFPIAAILGAVALSEPAKAQQTGGTGGQLFGGGGSPGSTDPTTGAGSNGGNGQTQGTAGTGGGGGGAGITGGTGGAGGAGGGAGGTSGAAAVAGVGGAGGNGGSGTGGGGGGGGAHGTVSATFPLANPATGGAGGAGGAATNGDGGGGGGGGYGVFVTGTGGTNALAITGGAGGAGGAGIGASSGSGSGGAGGVGVFFADGANRTLINIGTIQGGAGGAAGGNASNPGTAGAGGTGVVGSNLTVTLGAAGAISGGLAGGGGPRANAISFTGGTNAIGFGTATSGVTPGVSLTGGIGIAAGASVQLNAIAGGTMVANTISGAGRVIQNHVNTLTLSGTNTYSGGTTLQQGTLAVGNNSALGTGSVFVTGASSITNANGVSVALANAINIGATTLTVQSGVGGGGSLRFDGVISGTTGILNVTGSNPVFFTNTNTYGGGTILTNANAVIGANGALGTGVISLASDSAITTTSAVNAGPFTLSNNVNLAHNLSVNVDTGEPNLTLSGVISGGSLLVKGGSSGVGTVTLTGSNTNSGGTIINNGVLRGGATNTFSAASAMSIGASGTLDLGGFNQAIGSLTGSVGSTVTNSGGGPATLTAGGDNTSTTFEGVISNGVGATALTKTGSGTLTLTGLNSYSGLTTITSGTLAMSDFGALFGSSGVVANGTFDISGSSFVFYGINALSGSGAVTMGSNGLFIGAANGEFSGVISGSGGFEIGSGTQTLSGVNTYTNITQVDPGATLALKGAGSIASSAGVSFSGAGTFDISQTTSGATVSSLISPFSNASVRLGGQTLTITNGSVFAGVVSDGGIGGGTGGGLTIANGASQELSGISTYTGTTTINAGGELLIANNGSIAPSGVVADGIFDISQSNAATAIRSLTGANTGQVFLGANGLAVSNASGTFAGVIADGGFNGGTGGSLVLTSGLLSLSGNNTYTGGTTINGGNLRVNGSLASAVTVATGGTLSGTGAINSSVVVQAGGTLSAGQSPGTLTVGSLNLSAGSTSVFELGAANVVGGVSNDLVNVTGNLTLGGTLNVNAPSQGYYRLFNYGTLTPSNFSSVTGGAPGVTNTVLTNVANQVNLSVVGAGQRLQFWDGADQTGNGVVNGGAGTWSAANTNWTGTPGVGANFNDQWRGSVGIFAGATGGTVSVVGAQSFDTLQFSTTGYTLNAGAGGQLQLAGAANSGTINTDSGITATINAPVVNGTSSHLEKVGLGTLVLGGASTYTGGTSINGGVVNARNNTALGTGTVSVTSGAALQVQGAITLANGMTLNGTGVANDGALRNISGINVLNGGVTLGSATRINSDSNILFINGGVIGSGQNLTIGGAGNTAINSDIATGSGTLTKDGTGTLQLAGVNTFTGAVNVTGGSLWLTGGTALADSVALTLASGTTSQASHAETIGSLDGQGDLVLWYGGQLTTGANNASTTFSGTISEFGNIGTLTKAGTGTFTLTGNNSYTGGTTVSGGALNVQSNTALGTGAVSVVSGAALQMQGGITLANGITLNGAGVANNGALRNVSGINTFNGAITLGSATRINSDAGTLYINAGISGAGQNLTFGGAGSFQVNGPIATTTGTLTKDGAGVLTLRGANTFTGPVLVDAGILMLAGGSALADTVAVTMATGTTLRMFHSNIVGAPEETIGSLAGSGGVVLDTGTTLATGGNNLSTEYSGIILGAANLVKAGTGTFTLTGNNTYTGTTTVSAGTLAVNGSIATSSLTTVNAGGTLAGNGMVGNTTVNGGTLAPGNSIGALTVQGNLILTAASTYMVEVSPANADRVNVTGTANLGGAIVNAAFAPGAYVARQYTILNATGGLGGSTFGTQVSTNLPTGFSSNLSYDANNAYLNLALSFVPPTAPTFGNGLNRNQTNVANGLVNSFNTAGGIPLVFGSLSPAGLTQVSGEAATGSQQTTFDAMSQFIGVMTDPFMGARGGNAAQGGAMGYAEADDALAYAAKRNRSPNDALAAIHRKAPPRITVAERLWSVWGAGYGGTQSTGGNAVVGSNDTRSRVYGAAAGLDYRLGPDTLIGFSLGGAGTNFSVANGLGTGRSEMFQAGVYGRHTMGAAYIAGALAYGWQDVTTDRSVFGNSYRASFNADSLSARLESGYRFALGATSGLTPYAAGQVTGFWLPGYTEQTIGGMNTFALSYNQKDITASRSELGLRGDTSFAMQDAVLTLRGRAAWAHNFNTDRSINAVFQALPASGFTVNGATQARDAALLSAGGDIRWANGFSVGGTFEGEFSRNVDSYAGKGIVRYQW